MVYKKVSQFQEDEEGLGRFIFTDPNEIKDLVISIDHLLKQRVDNSIEDDVSSQMSGSGPR